MLIQVTHPYPIKPSEITPGTVYDGRRRFLVQMGLVTRSGAGGGIICPVT
jgi:glutaminase